MAVSKVGQSCWTEGEEIDVRTGTHVRGRVQRMGKGEDTHICALEAEGRLHFLQELVLLAVERQGLLFLVLLAAAGVASLRLPYRIQKLFLLATCNRLKRRTRNAGAGGGRGGIRMEGSRGASQRQKGPSFMANCTEMRTALSIALMEKSVFSFSSIATCFFSICGFVQKTDGEAGSTKEGHRQLQPLSLPWSATHCWSHGQRAVPERHTRLPLGATE